MEGQAGRGADIPECRDSFHPGIRSFCLCNCYSRIQTYKNSLLLKKRGQQTGPSVLLYAGLLGACKSGKILLWRERKKDLMKPSGKEVIHIYEPIEY